MDVNGKKKIFPQETFLLLTAQGLIDVRRRAHKCSQGYHNQRANLSLMALCINNASCFGRSGVNKGPSSVQSLGPYW